MKTLEAGKRIAVSNILFATDFSPYSDVALPYAMAVAHEYGAKLYGAHVVNSEDYLFTAPDLWPAHAEEEKRLEHEVLERLEKQLYGVRHEALSEVGEVWKVLSRLIRDRDIDLLVVGTHGRTGAKKLLMGSIAEKIFRQASCPVLSVGPNVCCKADREIKFRRILFATNFGKESLAALPFALSLAEEEQAELAFLHVIEQPAAGIANPEEAKADVIDRLRQLVPSEAESWCHVENLVEFGDQFARPAERIVRIARDRDADLIVIGARSTHGALASATHLATTAQQIVAYATCPVLTVRP